MATYPNQQDALLINPRNRTYVARVGGQERVFPMDQMLPGYQSPPFVPPEQILVAEKPIPLAEVPLEEVILQPGGTVIEQAPVRQPRNLARIIRRIRRAQGVRRENMTLPIGWNGYGPYPMG